MTLVIWQADIGTLFNPLHQPEILHKCLLSPSIEMRERLAETLSQLLKRFPLLFTLHAFNKLMVNICFATSELC